MHFHYMLPETQHAENLSQVFLTAVRWGALFGVPLGPEEPPKTWIEWPSSGKVELACCLVTGWPPATPGEGGIVMVKSTT